MFLRKKIISAGVLLALLTAFGAIVQAQQPSTQTPAEGPGRMGRGEGRGFRRGPRPRGRFGPRALGELNLTDAQKQQVRTIMQQGFESNKGLREEMRQLGEKRRQGTLTAADQTRARTLHEQMRAAMKERKTQIAAVLTADQKARLEALRKDRQAEGEGFRKRRGFRHQRGPENPPTQKPSSPSVNQ